MSEEANEQQQPTPTEKWLDASRDQWATLHRRAVEAAETTATPAWQANYRTQRTLHDRAESSAMNEIGQALETMRLVGTTEELEKTIKDAVKTLSEERVRYRAWQQRAIEVYRRSATELHAFVEGLLKKAREKERDNPLIERGFEADVKAALAHWGTAEWDEELGQVVMKSA